MKTVSIIDLFLICVSSDVFVFDILFLAFEIKYNTNMPNTIVNPLKTNMTYQWHILMHLHLHFWIIKYHCIKDTYQNIAKLQDWKARLSVGIRQFA